MEHHRNHEGREQHVHPSSGIDTVRDELESPAVANGSEHAPTLKATEREDERHRIERDLGRIAAGTMGMQRATQDASITRADLREAGRIADVLVGKRPARKRPRKRHIRH